MRCWIIAASFVLLQCGALQAVSGDETAPLASLGEQIYRSGMLPSGALLQARVQGDVPVSGAQITCIQCHRRSGYGSSESGRRIPPITAGALFSPKEISRRELYASRDEGRGTRPAYTEASLAQAIREGIDPAGRPLDPSMPRFALGDADMQALLAYLKTLSADVDPGVTATELHIATLIGPGVEPGHVDSMLAMMNAFITAKNSGTRLETRRAENTPWQKEASYPAYRTWVLHPWQLEGPPEQWPQQLQRHYQTQPVFAVVGGIINGDFQPIANFCNANTLPCLFPSTDHPASAPGFYTMHFNEGRRLEARALAQHLKDDALADPEMLIHQVYRQDDSSGAAALRTALERAVTLKDFRLADGPTPPFWQQLAGAKVLIAWLEPHDLEGLASLPQPWPERIYLQSTLDYAVLYKLPDVLRQRIYLLYPYALPEEVATQQFRVQTWLRHKDVAFDAPRVQADGYFAFTLFGDVMHQLKRNYSRAYAIEIIEHMLDNALFTSLYPQFSLAPGQRYASKGCYVVRLADNPADGVEAMSRWIVP